MDINSSDSRSDRSASRPLVRERKGAILALVAVCLVVLLGFLAMTLDVGAGNRQRRMAQTAADAGATAGAVELYRLDGVPGRHDSAVAAATREVVRNGFDAADIVSPCPCNPPISGPHTGDANYIEVRLLKSFATTFGVVFGQSSFSFGARGVGGDVPFAQDCLVALSPTGSGAISVTNGGSLSTTYVIDGHTYSCGVSVNSSSGSAVDVNQSGQLDAGTSSIGIVGGWDGNKTPTPAPVSGIPHILDPLANLVTMPAITACNTNDLATITKDTVLTPGVYCGGITISGKTATLTAGTYYIAGGGFNVLSSGIVNGDGVTIVMTVDPRIVGAKLPMGLNFGTGCKAKLVAPSIAGPFQGIVLYGDPAITNNPTNTFACASDASPELTGIVYFPNQTITFDGSNSGTEISGSVIASSIVSSGKVSIISDLSGTSVVHRPVLVE